MAISFNTWKYPLRASDYKVGKDQNCWVTGIWIWIKYYRSKCLELIVWPGWKQAKESLQVNWDAIFKDVFCFRFLKIWISEVFNSNLVYLWNLEVILNKVLMKWCSTMGGTLWGLCKTSLVRPNYVSDDNHGQGTALSGW